MKTPRDLPFLLGAQYYRAPTPEPECWADDLRHMRDIGMNAVKLWVQWRWSHRSGGRFVFDDVDRLMDLAGKNDLRVTLNTIFDVAPHWLYEKYPDARQVMNNGRVVEPYVVGHRQIGGHPGPCYNHPGALAERHDFMRATVEHFRDHPAMSMWDVWNEPELSFPQRTPNIDTLACYCPFCRDQFTGWLRARYRDLDHLNAVWGRCYEGWDQVEVPRSAQTFTDFIDWREFHIETMTREAAWRLDVTRTLDPAHVHYLHVVPNVMSVFNSVSCCVDDFEMASLCDVFAATMNGGPVYAPQVVSAARGKVAYNVESHLNFGSTGMHQRILHLPDLLNDWLPQIGFGIRGFLFWQFRPEVLGLESPAWGVVNLDGSDRPITEAVRAFCQKITPLAPALLACPPPSAEVGIWKSRKNEIFHFAVHGSLNPLIDSVDGYLETLYWMNLPYRIVDHAMLEKGQFEGIRLLILPSPYYLTEPEAAALDTWVKGGGVVLTEAHLAGYNGTTGRHSRVLPGCGLAQSWGIREIDTTSSYHLGLVPSPGWLDGPASAGPGEGATEDVRKALADFKSAGGQYYPIQLESGELAWGASRYARLSGEAIHPLGRFEEGVPCLAWKQVGNGAVFYAGANLGQGARAGASAQAGLAAIVRMAASQAGIQPALTSDGADLPPVHLDILADASGPRFLVAINWSEQPRQVRHAGLPGGEGLFTGFPWPPGESVELPPAFADLIVLS